MNKSVLSIDLQRIRNNLNTIKTTLSKNCQIMAIVKANAYGLGAVKVVETAIQAGVSYFGVAHISEGVTLRALYPEIKILLLQEPELEEIPSLIKNNLIPTVYTEAFIDIFNAGLSMPSAVHIKVNTGMNRLGVAQDQTLDFITYCNSQNNLKIEGLYTHLADANNSESTLVKQQINLFSDLLKQVQEKEINIPFIHVTNTPGTKHFFQNHFTMVRIGLGMMENCLTIKSFIKHQQEIKKGDSVGYDMAYISKKDTTIAVIPFGYADGMPVELSNKGSVLIKGYKYPIVGKVCMDFFMIDLGETAHELGAEVTILGAQGKEEITLNDISHLTGKQPRVLTCALGSRLERHYL